MHNNVWSVNAILIARRFSRYCKTFIVKYFVIIIEIVVMGQAEVVFVHEQEHQQYTWYHESLHA